VRGPFRTPNVASARRGTLLQVAGLFN